MTLDQIAKLKVFAEAATPGPWYPGHFCRDDHSCDCKSIVDEGYAGGIATIHVDNGIKSIADGGNDAPPAEEAKANQRYIAAADPSTILDIIASHDALVKALEAAETSFDQMEREGGLLGPADETAHQLVRAALKLARGE